MNDALRRSILGAKLRLKVRSPFFSVLLGHLNLLELRDGEGFGTACTDSKSLWINQKFWDSLSPAHREFLLAHEVMHAAMGHCWRVGRRVPIVWNLACDHVVNLTLVRAGFQPIDGAVMEERFSGMTADEIYAVLIKEVRVQPIGGIGQDVLPAGGSERDSESSWRAARATARTAERMFGHGDRPLGDEIDVLVEDPALRWEEILWKAMAQSRSDFGDWDRRLLHGEVYVEDLSCADDYEDVAICVDTSGSVLGILGKFAGAIEAFSSLYGREFPLYWADAALIGPVPMSEISKPRGGGGTSFVPFFDEAEKRGYRRLIYLTDLYGDFPPVDKVRNVETLWVVPAGTAVVPPFGNVAKMALDN